MSLKNKNMDALRLRIFREDHPACILTVEEAKSKRDKVRRKVSLKDSPAELISIATLSNEALEVLFGVENDFTKRP